jgi:hypothetical protein
LRLKASLAAGLLAAALLSGAPGVRAAELDLFPRPNEVFPVLLADPRRIQLSASYYRLDGRNASDIALGHSWGMTRWRSEDLRTLWEADVEGMAYSRFLLGGGINEFQTVDFSAALPLTVRRDGVAFKGALFHESSHLGDDYIRRTGDSGYRYSDEGLRGTASLDAGPWARLYGGASWLIHRVPATKRWTLQAGVELTSPDLGLSSRVPTRLFLAEDLQSHQRVQWNPDSRTVAGVRVGFRDNPTRDMRVQAGYFTGHSPYGQFFARKERYADLSVVFEL